MLTIAGGIVLAFFIILLFPYILAALYFLIWIPIKWFFVFLFSPIMLVTHDSMVHLIHILSLGIIIPLVGYKESPLTAFFVYMMYNSACTYGLILLYKEQGRNPRELVGEEF